MAHVKNDQETIAFGKLGKQGPIGKEWWEKKKVCEENNGLGK